MNTPFPIIYEDNHLLAVIKPAGLATMGVPANKPSLLVLAKQYIKTVHSKPGNVYLGTVSRLDAPVTGIVLFARTSKAAARLTEQFRSREVDKTYWAILSRAPEPSAGTWTDWVVKDERHRRMHVVGQEKPGAQHAELSYRCLSSGKNKQLVEIDLKTGRKHQIRLQFGSRGYPILGDRKYGGNADDFSPGIALHAHRLAFQHPVRNERIELVAPTGRAWKRQGLPLDEG
ncbi:MAG: RluA family pseudouridine synthase [Pirellulaceae bacterium]|nr:RluA family pseudouridine synthase [Pirellulaceae bacterium]